MPALDNPKHERFAQEPVKLELNSFAGFESLSSQRPGGLISHQE